MLKYLFFLIFLSFVFGCSLKADKVYFENLDTNFKGVCHHEAYNQFNR